LPEEVDHLLAAALRLILKEEMSNVLEQHEPGVVPRPKRNSSSTFFWLVYWLEGERALPSG
jgi:hypothetical protein